MKLAARLAAAAALVLVACEDPVRPRAGGAPMASAPSVSLAAEPATHVASLFCSNTWDSPAYLCDLIVTSPGSVPYVVAEWTTDGVADGPTWSPDATRIAFGDGSEVQRVSVSDGALTNLTNHPAVDASPAWSPNGARIAFQSDRDGPAELYVMNADGSNVVRLTHNVGVDSSGADPDWAPDGSRIVFTCVVESGNRDICRINADGTGFVRITNAPVADFDPAWSPNGSKIAFVAGSQLGLMNADGSGATQLASGYWLPRAPDWSPDGGRLVFEGTPQGGSGCDAGNGCPAEIVIMNADGSDPQLFTYGWAPAWAPVAPPVPVDQPPVARFTYSCHGLTCEFDGSASTDDRGIYSAPSWTFGDGTGATSLGARHTYAAVGTYTVTLTVTDGGGQSASASRTVTVTAPPDVPPVASFSSVCVGLACTFDSGASSDDVGIASRSWSFGDGSIAGNVVAPAHTFAAAATFAVTLTVTDTRGQSASRSQSVVVTDLPPTARFTSSCARAVCTFDGRSSTDELRVSTYAWELGARAGGTDTGPVVSVDYKRSGTFTVRLTVRDPAGQANSVTQTITVRK